MRKITFVALILSAFVAIGALSQTSNSQASKISADLSSLVENEREFARTAASKGMRTAFLAFISDDCILFRPTPVPGKKWWAEQEEDPALLSWEPGYADISQAGDLGYTTGPWSYRPKGANDQPSAFGYYMSIWRKQPDGSWKFVIDQGTSTPPPTQPAPALSFPADIVRNSNKTKRANVESMRDELLKQERSFSEAASTNTLNAFVSYGADDIRFMRPRNFPVVGKDAMRKALLAKPGTLVWEPTYEAAAQSGDLGYAYGTYEFKAEAQADKSSTVEKGNYVRVWKKRDGKWRVVVDILAPYPARKA